jgi:hypothetical protein
MSRTTDASSSPSSEPAPTAPDARPGRHTRPVRNRTALAVVALVAVMALLGTSCKQLHEDNRAAAIFGASNGQLPGAWLVPVRTGCSVYWEAAVSLQEMLAAAKRDGVTLTPVSCYRDYAGQVAARNDWCNRGACHMAAVPGSSNHGWGKAVDFRDQTGSMTYDGPGYKWLIANGGAYGWLHPKVMKQGGPVPEPWHWEWVGDGGRMFFGEYFGIGNGLPLTGSPIGNVDGLYMVDGKVRLTGWTFDPDQQDAIEIHVYVGQYGTGPGLGAYRANSVRWDVAAAYPAYSSRQHGFQVDFHLPPGPIELCVYAIDAKAPGGNPLLGCRVVNVTAPQGAAAIVEHDPGASTTTSTTAPPTSSATTPTSSTSTTTSTVPPSTDTTVEELSGASSVPAGTGS